MIFQWHAGNVACKVLMMIRTGGYILSSLMLIVLSVDRLIINTTNHHQKYNTSLLIKSKRLKGRFGLSVCCLVAKGERA